MELHSLKIELPANGQIILAQMHFIKTYFHMYNFVPTVDRDHYVNCKEDDGPNSIQLVLGPVG